MIVLVLLLCAVAVFLLWRAGQQRRPTGLPAGRVIYSDTRSWGALEQPLYDPELNLTGKPDYLVEQSGVIIPVEVKSSRVVSVPYDAHIYQLAVYCLLVQRPYGKRPPYGILHYPNRTYAIDYTPALEADLLELLGEMQRRAREKDVPRSHNSTARCNRCGFRSICDHK